MAMTYLKAIDLTGDAFWVGTQEPDKFDTKGRYSMVIGNLSDEAVKRIKDIGGTVLTNPNKESQGRYIKLKSGFPINAQTATGEPLKIVGNGSKIRVQALPAPWDFAGKKGVTYWVGKSGVTVDDLVVYNPEVTLDTLEDDVL